MISKLTPEQQAKVQEYYQFYLKKGLSTQPANRAVAEKAIKEMYRLVREKEPKCIWVNSPTELVKLFDESNLESNLWNNLWSNLESNLWSNLESNLESNLGAICGAICGAIWRAIWRAICGTICGAICGAIWRAICGTIWRAICGTGSLILRGSIFMIIIER